MGRSVLAVIASCVTWTVIVLVVGLTFRLWPAYEAAAPTMAFDLTMKLARLGLSTVALFIAAWVLWRIKASRGVELAFSIVMLIVFIPQHYMLWSKFPIWYHATFLLSLLVVPQLVAAFAPAPRPAVSAHA